MGIKIGYVDYNADNFHANVYLKAVRGELSSRGFEVAGVTALKEESSRAWAKANDVPWCDSPAELADRCDVFMVLAPSNPEVHLELCQWIFPFGKATYVDKTFAPDLATAQQIFALADEYGVPVQTTSALRYTGVQKYVAENGGTEAVRHMVAWGGGSSFGEYAIHPLEIVVSCMGAGAKRLMRRGSGSQSQLLIDFAGDRTAVVNVYVNAGTPFAASVTTEAKTALIEVDGSRLFLDTAAAVLDFLESGKPSIDREESLTIRRLLDAAADPAAQAGFIQLQEPTA